MTVVQASFQCPRGTMIQKPWGVQMHPSDWMIHRNRGRVPLFTRHTLGGLEAERDQRRRPPAVVVRCEPPELRCEFCRGPVDPCESCPHGFDQYLCATRSCEAHGEHVNVVKAAA